MRFLAGISFLVIALMSSVGSAEPFCEAYCLKISAQADPITNGTIIHEESYVSGPTPESLKAQCPETGFINLKRVLLNNYRKHHFRGDPIRYLGERRAATIANSCYEKKSAGPSDPKDQPLQYY